MSDGENFLRGPSFVFKNHESVSYTISTGGGGSERGNIEVTYDALRKRIAELEAALRDVLPYVDTCNSSHREAQAKGYATLEGERG